MTPASEGIYAATLDNVAARMVEITHDSRSRDGWVRGRVRGDQHGPVEFHAKVYDEPSGYGIDEGRVSKLWVDGLFNYDRGDDFDQLPDGWLRVILWRLEHLPAARSVV